MEHIDSTERLDLPEFTLQEALVDLGERHREVHGNKADAIRSTERIVASLGEQSREHLDSFMREWEEKRTMEGNPPTEKEFNDEYERRALIVLYHHYGYSAPGKPIKSLQFGSLRTKQYLEKCVREPNGGEKLQHTALVMLDVNGLKAVKECIGHYETNNFVKKLSQLLCNPEGKTQKWLEELGVESTALVAGGDEFAVLLHANFPMDARFLEEVAASYEQEVSNDPGLLAHVNFDDPNVLLNYEGYDEEEKKAFYALPDEERKIKLKEMRDKLPDKFTPSLCGGGVTMMDGLQWSLDETSEFHVNSKQTEFEKAGSNIFHGMFYLAEKIQHARKKEFKRKLAENDPKWALFLTRTREAEKIQERIDQAHKLIEDLMQLDRDQQQVSKEWVRASNGDAFLIEEHLDGVFVYSETIRGQISEVMVSLKRDNPITFDMLINGDNTLAA